MNDITVKKDLEVDMNARYTISSEEMMTTASKMIENGPNPFAEALEIGLGYKAANVEYYYILNNDDKIIHVVSRHRIENGVYH